MAAVRPRSTKTAANPVNVQRRRVAEADLSTAFWLNVATASVLAAGMAALTPLVALLYGEPQVIPIMLVLARVSAVGALRRTRPSSLRPSESYALRRRRTGSGRPILGK